MIKKNSGIFAHGNRIALIVLTVLALLAFAACNNAKLPETNEPNETGGSEENAEASIPLKPGEYQNDEELDALFADPVTTVATVGDIEIKSDLLKHVAAFMLYANYNVKYFEMPDEDWRIFQNQILVLYLVQSELIASHLAAIDIDPITSEALKKIESDVDAIYARSSAMGPDLNGLRVSRADVEYVYTNKQYYDAYKALLLGVNPVTEAECETFYKDNISAFVEEVDGESPRQLSFEECRDSVRAILEGDRITQAINELKNDFPVVYNIEIDPETGEPALTVDTETE